MKSPQVRYKLGKITNLMVLVIAAPIDVYIGYQMAVHGILSWRVGVPFAVSLLLSVVYYLIEWWMLERLTSPRGNG